MRVSPGRRAHWFSEKTEFLSGAAEVLEDQPVEVELTRLPREPLDRLTKPFARFLGIEAAAGVILLLFTVSALNADRS